MADTIVTNTPASQSDSSAGWVVALIVLVAVIVGGVLLYQRGFFGASNEPQTPNSTNINVTVPNPTPTPAPAVKTTP